MYQNDVHGDTLSEAQAVGWTPLFLAVQKGETALVQRFIDSGASVNLKDIVSLPPLSTCLPPFIRSPPPSPACLED